MKIRAAPIQAYIKRKGSDGKESIHLPFMPFPLFLDDMPQAPPKRSDRWKRGLFWAGFVGVLVIIMCYYLFV